MRCPTLVELPVPPPGKTGWPWTIKTPQLPGTMPDGQPWPRISIVTPSYNQDQYIEETIRSVLLQGYPNLEYIIMDGGSTDESVEIIRKYQPWLAYWVSEKDCGQSSAINQGMKLSSGLIATWLNSDDIVLPETFSKVALASSSHHPNRKLLAGFSEYRNEDFTDIRYKIVALPNNQVSLLGYVDGMYLAQPSVYFYLDDFLNANGLNEDLHYVMDLDLWIRLVGDGCIQNIPYALSWMRMHNAAKTISMNDFVWREVRQVLYDHRGLVEHGIYRRLQSTARRREAEARCAAGYQAYTAGNHLGSSEHMLRALMLHPRIIFFRAWIGLLYRLLFRSLARKTVPL